ncbi:hypothetical protein [Algirhabdus cladophorae]|uniref:hypothetical protein n=1 Tax=Algirhabdus cladophorae TaxID=3377108 RepID=UPI003B845E3F
MRALLFLLFMVSAGHAQDRDGNDTPGEWRITTHNAYGLWDSFCDERVTDGTTEERCYLRYVDVFSGHPKFAAMYLFVTPQEVEFGIERGTRFAPDGFRIMAGTGAILWSNKRRSCLAGRQCTYTGQDAADLLGLMAQGQTLVLDFSDPHGADQVLNWDLTQFAEALKNYRANALSKGLL